MKFFLEHYDGVLLMLGAGGITILAKTIVACIYTELLHQVHHISTTKNKWMKNTISKYETTYKMNLKINDTKSFVFMQMKDVKYLGINLYNLKNTGIYGAAVTTVIYVFYIIGGYYESASVQWYIKMSIASGTVLLAIFISELFLQLKRKDRMLRQELYDYIENNMKPHLLKSMVQSQKAADEKKKQDEAEAAVANENNSLQSVDAGQMSDKNKLQEGAACQKEAFDEDAFDREEIELFEEIMEKKYSISDASRQVEVENHVLRYWEEELGLNIHRNSKGHRFYTDRDIKILRDVKDLKEQGFLLKSIKLIIHDIDNVRKMNPNEQYKLREELNQKIQDEEENNSNKAKTVNGFMISRSQSMQTDNVVQLENKNMSGAAGQVLNIQKGELGQTAFKQGEQRSVAVPSEEKIKRFELMLRKMVANVVEEGQKESEQRISDNVSTKLMKEINYIMMQKDEMAAKQTKLLEEILQKIQSQSLEEVAATSQIKQLKTKEKKKDDKKDKVKEKGKNKRGLRIFG